MSRVALGIDVGTGSTKVAIVDVEGEIIAVGRRAHPILTPRRGWSESDPLAWLESARAAVNAAMSQAGRRQIVAIGLSGQMHGVVLCDAAGVPVRNAVLWSDQRAEPDVPDLRRNLEPLASILANPVVAGMAGPTIAALKRSEPDILGKTAWILQAKDWLRLQLTGEVATDPSDASATLLWDMVADGWSEAACEAFGVERSRLPPVYPSGAETGRLIPRGSAILGLDQGIPVAVGAADTAAALLGSGVDLGETQVSTGTGAQIARLLDSPTPDPGRRTHLFRAAGPDRWYAMAAMQNAGVAIDWALTVFGTDLDEAGRAVDESPFGSHGVVFAPYLTGERTPHLDAALTAQWSNLHLAVTRHDLVRAVFEGVACSIRDGLDALHAAGHSIESALLSGGGSVAVWWQQLLADVLEVPLTPHDSVDASARGAALLGLQCVGAEASPRVRRQASVEPRSDPTALLHRYKETVATMLNQ